MKNTLFFTHDFYARQDPKLQSVLAEHGAEGLGIYWCIIEQLYEQGGSLPLQVCKSIAFALHVECKVVTSIINDFGLFVIEGENFTSSSIKKRLEKSSSVSESRRIAAKSRWKAIDTQEDMQMQCKCNANAMQNDANNNDIDNNIKKKLSKDNSQKETETQKTGKNEEISENEMEMFAPEEIETRNIPQEIVDRWNNAVKLHNGVLPKVARLSDARKEKILSRYEEFKECGNPIEVFGVIIEKCFASTFLTKQWKVQFDWLFQNDKNWIKVYEGNYDNNPTNTTQDNGNNSDDRYAARRRTETKATSWEDYSEVF